MSSAEVSHRDLATRIGAYIGDRNLLIHEWTRLHGWSNDTDAVRPVVELANQVTTEANYLRSIFANFVLKFATEAEMKLHMSEIFRRAHLETMLTTEQIAEIGRTLEERQVGFDSHSAKSSEEREQNRP